MKEREGRGQKDSKEAAELGFEGRVIHDFFDMSETQEKRLKDAIDAAKGEVRVFVHPFCNIYNSSADTRLKDLKYANQVNKAALDAVTGLEGSPVLMMEEYSNLPKLEKTLQSQQVSQIVAVVKTEREFSTPRALSWEAVRQMDSKETARINWEMYLAKLKSLGVTDVIVSGSFLWIDNKEGEERGENTGCVGGVIRYFDRAGLTVRMGDTNPVSRLEVSDAETSEFKKYL